METRLQAVTRHLSGAERTSMDRVVKGVGNVQTFSSGGFKSTEGESGDVIKGAFELSGAVQVDNALTGLATQFTSTTSALRDAGLITALGGIKRGLDGAAASATDVKGKLKALGDARKDIERLMSGASGSDKNALEDLKNEIKKLTGL